MNKVILKEEDIRFLLKWRDENKDLVRLNANPMKAVKIVCVDSGYTVTAVREGSSLRLGVNEKGMSIGSLTFKILDNGQCMLLKDKTNLSREDKQAVLTVYCSVMALLVFGKETSEVPISETQKSEKQYQNRTKKPKKPKKSKQNGITYILNRSKNKPQLTVEGSHASPQGTFSVRGHYRHYKNGKVIWIAEFTKGSGKKKDKTYKVGRHTE